MLLKDKEPEKLKEWEKLQHLSYVIPEALSRRRGREESLAEISAENGYEFSRPRSEERRESSE